jgi:hypothetical protein
MQLELGTRDIVEKNTASGSDEESSQAAWTNPIELEHFFDVEDGNW